MFLYIYKLYKLLKFTSQYIVKITYDNFPRHFKQQYSDFDII